jgi:histidinol-phosphate phosphatase family protein
MGGAALLVEYEGVLVEPEGARDPLRLRLLPGVAEAVRRLALRGVPLVVVTDQPAIGRGETGANAWGACEARLLALLRAAGGLVLGVHCCPAAGPDPRRKPRPGLILAAARAHQLDLPSCWLVGTTIDDARAAGQAGCAGAVLVGGAGTPGEDLGIPVGIATDLADAPRVMLPRDGGCWHDRP